MEILNAYSGNGHPSATFYEHKRYTNFIDLDNNYRLLGEVFRVDDLLDFSNDDIAAPIGNSLNLSVQTEAKTIDNAEPPTEGCRAAVVAKEKVEEVEEEAIELIDIPCDDAELEWLSNFVEDSSSIDEAPKLSGNNSFPFKGTTKEFEEVQCESPPSGLESSSASGGWKNQFPDLSSVPARARSKRSRTGSKVWSSDILTTPSSSTASGSSEPVSMLDDTSATPLHCFTATCSSSFSGESSYDMQENFELPIAKKPKGKKKQENSQLQKCLHCGSQKTPQWRTGPLGPKTLCNACGVRFKSGRLFPEYRPAASPTFLPQVHSNSHKKVLEMRRQKEDV